MKHANHNHSSLPALFGRMLFMALVAVCTLLPAMAGCALEEQSAQSDLSHGDLDSDPQVIDSWSSHYAITWDCTTDCSADFPWASYNRFSMHDDTGSAVLWSDECTSAEGCIDFVAGLLAFPESDQCGQMRVSDSAIEPVVVCMSVGKVFGTVQSTESYPANTWRFTATAL